MSKRFFFNAVLVFLFTLFLLSLHNLRQVVCGQMLPWKIAPRLGLGFGSELGLGLRLGGGGAIFLRNNCLTTKTNIPEFFFLP